MILLDFKGVFKLVILYLYVLLNIYTHLNTYSAIIEACPLYSSMYFEKNDVVVYNLA